MELIDLTSSKIIKPLNPIKIIKIWIIVNFFPRILSIIRTKNFEWPAYDVSLLKNENIIIVVQINGKKRGLIETKTNVSEKDVVDKIMSDINLSKYIENKKIKKKIFVQNKLINIII